MGNCNFKTQDDEVIVTGMSKSNFIYHYAIGRGGFGKVWKVEAKKQKCMYAMKEMSKPRILVKKSVHSIMNERNLLASLRNPFLVNMIYAFQDRENIYLVLDLMTGGDLRYHICRHIKFNEEQTKFIIACLLLGLEYLHSNGIIHRDIKPENLVFDENGYLHLTDLGIARVWRPENSNDTSGTPGYMAPEVMCRQNHGVAADYFAVGVIAYELMMGRRPYYGGNRKEIRDAILARQVQIKKGEQPKHWSPESIDFVNKLIQRKAVNRLGLNGPEEVKNHPWFNGFNWEQIKTKEHPAPFVPNRNQDNFDAKYANAQDPWKDENSEVLQQNALLLRRESVQDLFDGYDFEPGSGESTKVSSLTNSVTKSEAQLSAKMTMKSSLSGHASGHTTPQHNLSHITFEHPILLK